MHGFLPWKIQVIQSMALCIMSLEVARTEVLSLQVPVGQQRNLGIQKQRRKPGSSTQRDHWDKGFQNWRGFGSAWIWGAEVEPVPGKIQDRARAANQESTESSHLSCLCVSSLLNRALRSGLKNPQKMFSVHKEWVGLLLYFLQISFCGSAVASLKWQGVP